MALENSNEKTPKKRKSRNYTAFRVVVILVISIVLGISLYYFNAASISGNRLPMPFGYGASIVVSGSMEPEISVNDLVIVKETEGIEDISVGDVVVYESGDILVIHEVIDISGETITTKGIANNVADSPIDVSSVKGVMVGKVPLLGPILSAIKTPVGIFFMVVLAVVLFELPYFLKKRDDDKELDKIREEINKLKN